MLKPNDDTSADLDLLYSVAVGRLKEARRYQATQQAVATGSFKSLEPHLSRAELTEAEVIIQTCSRMNLEVLPVTSPRYPRQLREVSAPPAALYVHTLEPAQPFPELAVGVVGTRAASLEVCRQASELSATLAHAGVTVVSGLALGIDGAAHRGALESGRVRSTIAVLAHGLDRVYPPTHIGLAREILNAGGVIVSEYAPGVEPMKHHFLARNRIIAGLSRGVVVVQAGARSGSLVTANFAADYGRDVFVVQDPSDADQSLGGAALIEQGAIAITSATDVLREYKLVATGAENADSSTWVTMSLDSFIAVTALSPAEVLRLELQGHLIRLQGNQVRVSPTIGM